MKPVSTSTVQILKGLGMKRIFYAGEMSKNSNPAWLS